MHKWEGNTNDFTSYILLSSLEAKILSAIQIVCTYGIYSVSTFSHMKINFS